ncbi:glycosyltransferase [Oribacterium sp. KHPX15]|uniref:glycosyltransferase n=1 Tax=Oribacterium sp. KHPX15 TaxID=1855342 RepID=UPI000A9F302A|nr:glycosyltransferase [Oribacterium sp. KHPX15]
MEKVVILMSTYNGDRYLENQIESLLAQEGLEVCILARDDGSSDNTLEILDRYKKEYSEEEVINKNCNTSFDYYVGQNLGPAGSFLDLMKQAPEAEYYALCDQDDTWLPDKLKIAVEAIKQREGKEETPILYYGMPRFADNDGNLLKGSKGIYEKSLDFPSCLIKSNSTGCTMVFNRTLLELINRKSPNLNTITMHDEWLHKVCLAVGGILIYDEDVHILYRQHGSNTIGGQLSMRKVLKRYWKTLMEPDCIRSKCVKSVVDCYGNEMSPQNIKMAEKVASYKNSFRKRIELLLDKDIKMEYPKRNIMFKLAVLLGIF